MRYISIIAGLALAVFLLLGCMGFKAGNTPSGDDVPFGNGTPSMEGEGAAMGYRGMIHVRVSLKQGAITEITVIESREDRAIGGAAMEELTDLVLMYNTTELDAVSGATETSKGFLEAIENAIMNL
jgi:Na+-translocating ferredoxin:NAD+ oxidoreductase RnfG subunit